MLNVFFQYEAYTSSCALISIKTEYSVVWKGEFFRGFEPGFIDRQNIYVFSREKVSNFHLFPTDRVDVYMGDFKVGH